MLNYQGRYRAHMFLCRVSVLSLLTLFSLGTIANQASAQIMDSPAETAQRNLTQQIKKAKPQAYQLSSRIHLNKGTRTGYLVVEVQLAGDKHIYSLTQGGVVPPTTLKVLPNAQIKLTGDFSPDTPATVIENDPIFQQRLEKHTGKVQFFAPIEVDPAADLAKLATQIQFDGQVCSKEACVPIRAKMISGKFAGYFDSTPAAASVAKQPATQPKPDSGARLE